MISNSNCNLTYYCEKNIPEELSLILPACEPFVGHQEEKFSALINQIYTDCKKFNRLEQINYKMDFTWAIHLFQKNVFINTSQGQKKLNDLRITSYQNLFLMKWEFEMENNNTESYIISPFDSEAEIPQTEFLNGLEFEKIFSSDFVPLLSQRFWDTWEQRPELEHYETIIYPQIINTIQKICKLNPLISLDIIDLGGGSGILAERILKESNLTDSLRKIVVIDSNSTLIKKAQERAVNDERLIPQHISVKKMHNNLYNSLDYHQSAHMIILCGVVAHQVLSKKRGLKIIRKCHSILRENGIIIAGSFSPPLINSSEYKKMGYNVLNKSFTFKDSQNEVKTHSFYILQKKLTT